MSARHLLIALAALGCVSAGPTPPDNAATLDGLVKEFLFDPKGAERVEIKAIVRSVWASSGEMTRRGWLVPAAEGRPARVHFTDGASVLAPPAKDITKVDFLAECRARYPDKPAKEPDDEDRGVGIARMRREALAVDTADDLVFAAWLHRLGEKELSARALTAARAEKGDPVERLRGDLAWAAYAGMVHAFMVRADDEALAHGERLLRLYPAEVKKEYAQATAIVADLKRRKELGTFGKQPAEKWPDGFADWEPARKVQFLIDALDDVDARQHGQPGGVDLSSDRRVEALIAVGDPAVPALIDALEDNRLTRSVHFWRDFARHRTVLGTREAALTAVMSILRVRVFEPGSTGDNFTARGEDGAKQTADRLRAYWKQYGRFPFDDRMMRVLTDPNANTAAKREAAVNLATIGDDHRLGTTVWTGRHTSGPDRKPNPVVAKFSKPTVAEAILSALDADTKGDGARRGNSYLSALVELGDKRAAPEVVRRATAAKSDRERLAWAEVALPLGDPAPLRAYADDFRAGKLALTTKGEESELDEAVSVLVEAHTPEADRALDALADPKHPLHKAASTSVREGNADHFRGGEWFAHPFCLALLRRDLGDTTPTGAKYSIKDDRLTRDHANGFSSRSVPGELADPAVRRENADERVCDVAAEKLAELVVGLPRYHPLFKDADSRLTALRTALDRFAGNYRRATYRESSALRLSSWGPTFIPALAPLGRTATAEDVKAGRAIFHLDGKGKPATTELPATAELKEGGLVLVVQAETGPDGAVTFGILSRDSVRSVPESGVMRLKSFARLDAEEAERRKKME